MNWEALDWEVLDRLRATFLSDDRAAGPYWHSITDLECYDFTYGTRIGWKWDAVLAELRQRGWSPPAGGTLLDWGCGSGVAHRQVLAFFGPGQFAGVRLHDHSALALDYSEHRAGQAFPGLPVARASAQDLRGDTPIDVLVVSHVLNELNDTGRAELRALLARARTVLWVEPGTHEASRALGAWREACRADGLMPVAPCPHRDACGVLAPGNERHWCHFFADPPPGIHADSHWVKFGQRAGIDLRALPYAFLVLDRRPAPAPPAPGTARLLGEPRLYKGYARLFTCTAAGVGELTLQKRDDPALFKALKQGRTGLLHQWTITGDRITGTSPPA